MSMRIGDATIVSGLVDSDSDPGDTLLLEDGSGNILLEDGSVILKEDTP